MNNKIDINAWSPRGDRMTKDGAGPMKCTRSLEAREPQAHQYRTREIWIINQNESETDTKQIQIRNSNNTKRGKMMIMRRKYTHRDTGEQ